jgi:hypothetical protein
MVIRNTKSPSVLMAWRFLLYLRITCSKISPVSETRSNFAALDNPRQAFAHCAVGDFQCLHLIGKFTDRSVSLHSFEDSIPPPKKKKNTPKSKIFMPFGVGAAS